MGSGLDGTSVYLARAPLPWFQTPGTETQGEAEFHPPLEKPQVLELGTWGPATSMQKPKVSRAD